MSVWKRDSGGERAENCSLGMVHLLVGMFMDLFVSGVIRFLIQIVFGYWKYLLLTREKNLYTA